MKKFLLALPLIAFCCVSCEKIEERKEKKEHEQPKSNEKPIQQQNSK